MALQEELTQVTVEKAAATDLSAWQFKHVRISGGQIARTITLRGTTHGILLNAPVSGAAARMLVDGLGKVVADGSVSEGDFIGSDASGRATTLTPGSGSNANSSGWATEDDGAAGTVIQAVIRRASLNI